jgi:hypothetical protein
VDEMIHCALRVGLDSHLLGDVVRGDPARAALDAAARLQCVTFRR